MTYRVLGFRVIGKEAIKSFCNNNLIIYFLMSKWSEGFLDLGFQGACKQKKLILIFYINIRYWNWMLEKIVNKQSWLKYVHIKKIR